MAAIRNVMTFKRQPVQNITINRYVNVQQPTVKHNSGMGLAWAFFGVNALSTIFSGLSSAGIFGGKQTTPPQTTTPQDTQEFDNLKKVAKDFKYEVIQNPDGTYTAYKTDGSALPITGDYQTVLDSLMTVNKGTKTDPTNTTNTGNSGSEEVVNNDGKGGIKYDVDPEYGNTTLDIKKGYTWYNIVSAKYDIPKGVSAKDVALALAAANSGAEGTEAMDLARQGVYFKVGDLVNLPDTLNVNGKEISLKSDHQNQAVTPQDYGFVKATHWSAKVTQVGDKWYVRANGTRIGEPYNTEAEANAAKAELEAQQNAE